MLLILYKKFAWGTKVPPQTADSSFKPKFTLAYFSMMKISVKKKIVIDNEIIQEGPFLIRSTKLLPPVSYYCGVITETILIIIYQYVTK